jgi:hypothetical protein
MGRPCWEVWSHSHCPDTPCHWWSLNVHSRFYHNVIFLHILRILTQYAPSRPTYLYLGLANEIFSSALSEFLHIPSQLAATKCGVERSHSNPGAADWQHARNIPSAFSTTPPENEQIMLETCRGTSFLINWIKSASRWFHYNDILWCTVNRTWSALVILHAAIGIYHP